MVSRFQDLSIKDRLSYILCVLSFLAGTTLTFISIFLKPIGEIHSSVLTSLGVFLSFSGALIGLNLHYSTELSHFKKEIENVIESKKQK